LAGGYHLVLAGLGQVSVDVGQSVAAGAPVGYYNPLTLDTQVTQPTRLWGAQLFAGYRFGQGLSYTGIPIYDGKIETNDYGEVRAGLTVPLLRNGPIDRARANIQRAEHGRTAAEMGAVVELLQGAMDRERVPFGMQNKLLAKLAPMKRSVVVR
jgi:hypothetical protein